VVFNKSREAEAGAPALEETLSTCDGKAFEMSNSGAAPDGPPKKIGPVNRLIVIDVSPAPSSKKK